MLNSRCLYKPIPNDSDQPENIPLGTVNKKRLRRIRKCPDFGGQPEHKEKLLPLHPRFGPFYRENESKFIRKEDAWDKILEKSGDQKNETTQIYSSAMKMIERDARNAYEDSALDTLKESEFRWMMIKDGCFFLQLALLILGVSSEKLGYSDNHPVFGKQLKEETITRWIESMFFVGNQIPLVVLNELLKQTFFQNILKDPENSWKVPSEVSKRILYELLVLPAKEYSKQETSPAPRRGLVSKRILHELLVLPAKGNWLVEQHPSDLLHALHCSMFGSGGGVLVHDEARESGPRIEAEDEDDDLESRPNMESKDGEYSPNIEPKAIKSKEGNSGPNMVSRNGEAGPKIESKVNIESKEGKSGPNMESKDGDDDLESGPNIKSRHPTLSATELKKKGIRFGKLEQMGRREIVFTDYLLFARLYLPTFAVDDDTEALWKSLKYYEMTRQQGNRYREVRSYLQFMNDLICTEDDVRLLAKKGIIKANNGCNKYELPKMLRKLAGKEEITTPNHHQLRIRLTDYGLAPWERFKIMAILLFILTAVQTFFTVLAYFASPLQK